MKSDQASILSDELIIDQILRGDRNLFSLIFDRYQYLVVSIVKKQIPRCDIDEVVQSVFIKVFQSLKDIRDPRALPGFIKSISIRCSYDYFRKSHRKKEFTINDDLKLNFQNLLRNQTNIGSSSQVECLLKQESQEFLNIALNHLSAEDRMIMQLIYFDEMSIRQASEALDFSMVNVKVRSFRIRKKLKLIIEKLVSVERSK